MVCSFTDPHRIVLLDVAFDSVTVRSREFWSMYIGVLTHATRNVQTQVKMTVKLAYRTGHGYIGIL